MFRKTICCLKDFDCSGSVRQPLAQLKRLKDVTAKNQSELDAILPELKGPIRDYVRYLRAIAVETLREVFGTQSKNNRFPKMFENPVNLAPTAPTVPTAPKNQSSGLVGAIALPMALVVTAAIMFTLLVSILRLNHGVFIYSLDDAYIELALSDQIRHGNYGMTDGLHAAPASSILYPFLLAPASGTPLHPYVPLILNSLALFATLAIMWRLFMHLRLVQDTFGMVAQAIALLLLAIDLNLIAVVFTGLEHSLHIATVAATVYGLVLFLDTDKIPKWLPVVLVLAPLLRYEGLALSLGALLVLAMRGRLRMAVGIFALIVLFTGGFSVFLISLGLPPLPSSILSKSTIVSEGMNGAGGGMIRLMAQNAIGMARAPAGALMLVIGAAALVFCLENFPVRRRHWTSQGLLALLLFTFIAAHALAGRFGWLFRYEDYALLGTALIAICLLRKTIQDAFSNKKARLLLFCGTVVSLAVFCGPYILSTVWVPLASNNIYEQQFQMHRFVNDFYRAAVAVNDLGLVSYHNPSFVLDLGGLASEKGRILRSSNSGPEDYRAFVGGSGAHLVIIYREWFPGKIPASWIRVSSMNLSRKRVSSSQDEVDFFATDTDTADIVVPELQSFSKTLPPAVKLTIYSPAARSN
jgi:hypothetical protein